jgi:hypothetical protein
LQAQRVVLIVHAELLGAESALADDVGRTSQARRFDPGFEGDRVVQAKAQGLAVLHLDDGLLAIAGEEHGRVGFRKAGIRRRTRSDLLGVIEAPLHDRRELGLVRDIVARAVVLGENGGGEKEGAEKDVARHALINGGLKALSAPSAPHFREGRLAGAWLLVSRAEGPLGGIQHGPEDVFHSVRQAAFVAFGEMLGVKLAFFGAGVAGEEFEEQSGR